MALSVVKNIILGLPLPTTPSLSLSLPTSSPLSLSTSPSPSPHLPHLSIALALGGGAIHRGNPVSDCHLPLGHPSLRDLVNYHTNSGVQRAPLCEGEGVQM